MVLIGFSWLVGFVWLVVLFCALVSYPLLYYIDTLFLLLFLAVQAADFLPEAKSGHGFLQAATSVLDVFSPLSSTFSFIQIVCLSVY